MKKILSSVIAAALLLAILTGCSSAPEKALTSAQLAAVINENGGEMAKYNPAAELGGDSAGELMQWQGWDKSCFETGAFSFSLMNVQAYTIAVVKPAAGKKDTVLKYFADYQEQMKANFNNYLADQYEVAKNAVTEETNGYIVFVMAENADSVAAAIKAKL